MQYLKQSISTYIQLGPFVDETNGNTAEGALTITSTDVWLSKNGGAFANPSDTGAASHDRAGWYRKNLNVTDTGTCGQLIVAIHETGALPVWREFMVIPAKVYDSMVLGTDYLEVDIEAVSGDEGAADNLELDYDGTGYAKANSTIGTVTTNTDLVSAAAINTEVDNALSDIHLDHLLAVDYNPAAKPGVATALLNELVQDDAGESQFTVNALEQAPSGTGASAAVIADAVWEELIADHSGTSGSTAEALDGASAPSAADVADAVWDELVTGHDGAGKAGQQLWTDVDAILADTDELQTDDTPAAIAALPTAVENRTEMDSNSTKLSDIVADTNELQVDDVPGLIGALNDVSTTEVNTEVDSALTDIHLDHLLAVEYDPASQPGVATALLNELIESDAGISRFTANALEEAPAGGASAADIADAVWDEAATGHTDAGKAGQQLWTDIDAILADTDELQTDDTPAAIAALPTAVENRTEMDSNSTKLSDIVADTNELQVDDVPGLIGALNDLSTTEVNTEVDSALADIHLDHLLAVDYNPAAKPGVATALLNELVQDDAGESQFTVNALEQGPSGTGASAAVIADAVWDESLAGHTIDNSTGEALGSTEADAASALNFCVSIVADTNELQLDDVPGLISALNDISTTEVNTEVDSALADIHLDHLLATDYDPASKPGVATALLNELVENDAGESRFTENSLEQAPSGTGASAAVIADAVWNELSTGHTDAGKAGEQLWTDVDAILSDTNELQTDDTPAAIAALPTAVENRTEMDSNSTKLSDIVADTNELQVDDVPGLISALSDPSAATIADAVWDESATGHIDAGKAGQQLWTDVDAILADTNELQTDDTPAAIAALPTAVENRTEMDSNSTKLSDIVADTNELQIDDVPGLIGALNDVSTTEVNTEVDSALADIHLDHLFATNYDPASKPGIATALLNELVESDVGVSRFTANALEEAPAGGASAADIADAVWDEAATGHTEAGKAGQQLWTDIDAILADTDELQTDDTPAAIAALPTAVENRTEMDSNSTKLADIVADTNELQVDDVPGLIGALNDISTTEVNTEVDSALSDIHLDHLLATDYDPTAKPGTATALFNELVENDAGESRFTANALEQAPTGGSAPTVGDIADAVWDESLAGHTIDNSTGEALGSTEADAASALNYCIEIVADTNELQLDDTPAAIAALPTAVENRTELDTNSTKLADIVADTNELQVDDVPGLIGALNDVSTTEVNTEVDSALSDIHLDHLLATDYDPASKPGSATALLNELVENDVGVSRFTANALEEAPAGGASAADIADAVWDEAATGHTDAGKAGQQLWTDVDAILADTNELQTDDTPAAIAALPTAVENRTEMDSNSTKLSDIVADTNELQTDDTPAAIAALPTAVENRTELDTNSTKLADIVADTNELQVDDVPGLIGALNDISTTEVNTEVDSALADIHLDHLLATDYDPASKPGNATALLNELVESDVGVSRFTANALEEAPSGGASVGDIADAVWDESLSGHTIDNSTGEALGSTEADAAATLSYSIAIVSDTNELQLDDVPGLIAALNDPTAGAIADQVWEEALADHSGTSGSTAEALSQIPGAIKGAIEYTYTIDDGSNPIDGAEVWITTDSGGNNVIWSGVSDALGVARASDDEKPWLDAGTYYGWAQKSGYSFSNPDTLSVS